MYSSSLQECARNACRRYKSTWFLCLQGSITNLDLLFSFCLFCCYFCTANTLLWLSEAQVSPLYDGTKMAAIHQPKVLLVMHSSSVMAPPDAQFFTWFSTRFLSTSKDCEKERIEHFDWSNGALGSKPGAVDDKPERWRVNKSVRHFQCPPDVAGKTLPHCLHSKALFAHFIHKRAQLCSDGTQYLISLQQNVVHLSLLQWNAFFAAAVANFKFDDETNFFLCCAPWLSVSETSK